MGKKKKEASTATNTNTEVEVPYLLSLPMCISTCLLQHTYWMPHELLLIIKEKIAHLDMQLDAACWTPLTEWCLAASQLQTPTSVDSVVSISVNVITHVDPDLRDWTTAQLDMTMGKRVPAVKLAPPMQNIGARPSP